MGRRSQRGISFTAWPFLVKETPVPTWAFYRHPLPLRIDPLLVGTGVSFTHHLLHPNAKPLSVFAYHELPLHIDRVPNAYPMTGRHSLLTARWGGTDRGFSFTAWPFLVKETPVPTNPSPLFPKCIHQNLRLRQGNRVQELPTGLHHDLLEDLRRFFDQGDRAFQDHLIVHDEHQMYLCWQGMPKESQGAFENVGVGPLDRVILGRAFHTPLSGFI